MCIMEQSVDTGFYLRVQYNLCTKSHRDMMHRSIVKLKDSPVQFSLVLFFHVKSLFFCLFLNLVSRAHFAESTVCKIVRVG